VRDPSQYLINGIRVPSVTETLSLAGLVDLGGINPAVLEAARQRGNAGHAWLHGMETGVLEGLTPDPIIRPYVEGYLRFRDDKKFEVTAVEQIVKDETYMYAGTLDRTGIMDGEPWLLDLKLVAQVREESALQTAGYGACLPTPHKRGVLQLLPNGKYKLHPYTSRNDLHDFLSALRVAWCKIRWGRVDLDKENY
jgi:hypothetical protein